MMMLLMDNNMLIDIIVHYLKIDWIMIIKGVKFLVFIGRVIIS